MTGPLARPLTLPSGLELANRIAKASTSESLAVAGDPGPALERVYEAWSRGGSGLILTGNAMVGRRYRERMANVVLDGRTDRDALARWARASKTAGNAALVQINHPGRQTARYVASDPVGPSEGPAVAVLGAFARPRALRDEEIESIVDDFARAATLCVESGFDGVQIHAAHGYLLSQFLSPLTNRRTDRWGGSLENRARALLEAVARTRQAIGERKTIAVKLNSSDFQKGGFTPEDAMGVVTLLDGAGIDLLELSGGSYESPALLGLEPSVAASTRAREGYFLTYAAEARRRTRVPVMLTGGLRSRAAMEQALEEGALDVVGLARPLCLEPDLPTRLLSGEADRAVHLTRRRARWKALDAAAEAGFYQRQIARIAAGQSPRTEDSVDAAALDYVLRDAGRGVRRTLFGE
jgi:2,4-dienoyl-CoA reductase-like NADH-dependent reductase (Old Yellow Enzyme family)